MFIKAVKKINRSMFPIFRETQTGNNQITIGVAGTGFFINDRGDFISAAHVFHNPPANTSFLYVGRLPDEVGVKIPIKEIAKDEGKDLFIGHVDVEDTGHLSLENKLPKVGQSVCVAGYPLASIVADPNGGINVGGVRRYIQPSFVLDFAQSTARISPTATTNHQGFLVRDFGLFGMSGGPVVDMYGVVVGIQGAVTDPRTSSNGTQTISVQNAMVIQSDLFVALARINNVTLGANPWRWLHRRMRHVVSRIRALAAKGWASFRQPQTA